jgi:hypothetical protein
MASELQELFAELNKVAGEEKKKFAEKVKNDSDLQSMFSQLSEIKKENDKEKEKIEAKYAVPKIEEAKYNLLDELINISNSVQNPEPEPKPTLAELPKDPARGEKIEVEELSDTVKEILPVEEKKTEPIVELTTKHIKKSNLNEAKEEEKLEREFKRFKELVTKQLGSLGGGGAVNIRDLDDVDRTSALVDGKALVYQASSGKFIGGTAGGGVSSGTIEQEGSTDKIVLDGTDDSSTDAGDSITQEIGSEDYVLGKDGYINDDGFEYVNDNNTETVVDSVNTFVTLTNARKAPSNPVSGSLSQYLPKKHGSEDRIVRIWDDTQDKFFFNELERKDALVMRFGLKINPQVHNVRIVVQLLITLKHGGSFGIECPATILGPSGAGKSYDPEFITTFFIGDLEGYESTDTYGEVQVQGDGPFTVEDFDILTIKI